MSSLPDPLLPIMNALSEITASAHKFVCRVSTCVYIPCNKAITDRHGLRAYLYTCERCRAPIVIPGRKHTAFAQSPLVSWTHYRERA